MSNALYPVLSAILRTQWDEVWLRAEIAEILTKVKLVDTTRIRRYIHLRKEFAHVR